MARRRLGLAYGIAVVVLRPIMVAITRREWRGGEHIPRSGGFVAAPNHISHVDPITVAHFLYDHDRLPRFLAKAGLFTVPVIGWVIRNSGQIPVHRESRDAAQAFSGAVAAIAEGECVAVYAEGTITKAPGLWPMVGKTGAARIGLTTGCPVIPIAQWGPEQLLPPYGRGPRLLPRKTIRITAGPPVDLDDLRGRPVSPEVLREATERIMRAITALLAELRGEEPPSVAFDLRTAGLPRTGAMPSSTDPAGEPTAGPTT